MNGRVHDEWKAKFIRYMNGLAKNHAFFFGGVSKLTLALLNHFNNAETKKPFPHFSIRTFRSPIIPMESIGCNPWDVNLEGFYCNSRVGPLPKGFRSK